MKFIVVIESTGWLTSSNNVPAISIAINNWNTPIFAHFCKNAEPEATKNVHTSTNPNWFIIILFGWLQDCGIEVYNPTTYYWSEISDFD